MAPNDTAVKLLHRERTVESAELPLRHRTPGLVLKHMDPHLVSLVDPDSYESEQYRKLRYVLEEKRIPGQGLVVAICSPAAGDGKSLTAINLAAALAQAPEARVLLMDVDLRRESASLKSNLHLGKVDWPGLADVIQDTRLQLQDAARSIAGSNLSVVLTGTHASAPYVLV